MWKICIIDDDRQVLDGLRKIMPWAELELEDAGCAANGAEGMELVLDRRPDVVITDIYMPRMSGLEMIQRLRDEGYEGRIVILSGYSDFEYAREALRLKVDDYLSKPITAKTLESTLSKVIEVVEDERAERIRQDELLQKLLSYEPFIQQEKVKRMLTGSFGELPYRYGQTGVEQREASCFAVAIVELQRQERLENASASDIYLFRFAVGNIIQEILRERLPGSQWVEFHSYHTGILVRGNPSIGETERTAYVEDVCQELIAAVKQYLNVSVRIGVGGWKRSEADLSASTEEALRSLLQGASGEATASAVLLAGGPGDIDDSSSEKRRHTQAVEYVIEYIHLHYAEELSLEVLASKVYISRYYLGHIFRKVVGESFKTYVARVRMEKAKAMILEGKYLIYEIAEKVGYKNVPYFSSLFKKFVGCNPTEYVK